mgnify:CR=1 FL=1
MVLLGLRSVQQYTLFIVLTRLANLPKSGGSKYGQESVSVRGVHVMGPYRDPLDQSGCILHLGMALQVTSR